MKNYIEVVHRYAEPDDFYGVGFMHSEDVFYAVRPSSSRFGRGGESLKSMWSESWSLNGSSLQVHGLEDIAGLRKLLDAVEVEMKKEEVGK